MIVLLVAAVQGCTSTSADGKNGATASSSGAGGSDSGAGAAGRGSGADSATGAAGAAVKAPRPECLGHDFNLGATKVSAAVTFGGVPIPVPWDRAIQISLQNGSGDLATLDYRDDDVEPQFSSFVLPGSYDLYFSLSFGTSPPFPRNERAKVRSGVVVGDSAVALALDIPITALTTKITVNGGPAAPNVHAASLELRTAEGDRVPTASIAQTSSSLTQVVAGTYDVYYTSLSGSLVDTAAKIRSRIVLPASPTELAIDLALTPVAVTPTLAGIALTDAEKYSRSLVLRNDAGDQFVLIPSAASAPFTGDVIAGTYDLYFGSTKVKEGVVVGSSPLSVDVDIPATTVSGKITFAGAPLRGSVSNPLSLRAAGEKEVPLTLDEAGQYSQKLVSGSYDLIYRGSYNLVDHVRGEGDLPANLEAVLARDITVAGATMSLDFDIPKTSVSGRVKLNGQAISGPHPVEDEKEGFVGLTSDDGGEVRLATIHDGVFDAPILPGVYNVWYAGGRHTLEIPINSWVRLEQRITVGSSPVEVDIDVPGIAVTGVVTVNGAAVGDDVQAGFGLLMLDQLSPLAGTTSLGPDRESINPDPAALARGAFSALVAPGSYELTYLAYSPGPGVPGNLNAHVGCLDVR